MDKRTGDESQNTNDMDVFVARPPKARGALALLGFERQGQRIVCRYGCDGIVSHKVPELAAHVHDCQFWEREGKTLTPF